MAALFHGVPLMIAHSIIIPTRNRSHSLRTTLESVAKLQGLDAVEVIVVDNGSNDDTKEVCRAFHASIKSLIYGYDETPGLLTGRHKGTSLAHASILSFIDDDVELNPEWSVEIRRAFERNGDIHFVTGPSLPKYENESPAWLKYFWTFLDNGHKYCPWLSLMDEGEGDHDIDPTSVWGLNFSIKKNALLELGGFHPDNIPVTLQKFQGDGETGLTLKAREKGYRARYVSGARLHHLVPRERMTFGYFKKRFFYQGVCDSYTWLRRKHGLYATEKKQIENPATDRKQGTLFRLYNKFANRVRSGMENISEKRRMHRQMNEEYEKGFAFHQHAFEEQEMVRQWVLKKDYWDYQLPHYDRQVLT